MMNDLYHFSTADTKPLTAWPPAAPAMPAPTLPPLSEMAQLFTPEREVDVRLMNGVTWSATLIERDGQGVLVRMAESRRRVFVPWTNVAAIRDALPDDDRNQE